MSSPFIAEIRIFAGNFAPLGWALCDGQLLPISQNPALFSLPFAFFTTWLVSRFDRSKEAVRVRFAFDAQHVAAQTGFDRPRAPAIHH